MTTANVGGVVPAGGDAPVVRRPTDFPCFDGLRAIAVLTAMFGHVGFVSGAEFLKHEWYAPLLARLEMGPAIFFMMSGFLLYRSYLAAAFAGRKAADGRTFFRHRALRIIPAYWLALTFTLLFHHATTVSSGLSGGFSSFSGVQLLSLYTLTQIYVQHWFFGGMSQSYTLAVEITFYLMLPGYALLMRRLGEGRDPDARLRLELWGAAVLYLISLGFRTIVFYGGVLPVVAQHWLPGYLDVFAIGMALAAVHVWKHQTGGRLAAVEWFGDHSDLCLVGAAACFLIVTFCLNIPRGIVEITGDRAYARNFLHGLGAGFMLLPAVFGPQDVSLYRRFLRWQPMVYLGVVSFGTYLWHNNFLEQTRIWARYPLFGGNFVLLFTVTFTLSVIVASASYFLMELPIFRRRDQWPFVRRPREVTTASAPR